VKRGHTDGRRVPKRRGGRDGYVSTATIVDERTMHEKARHSSIIVYRTIVMRRLAAPLSYNSLADEEDVVVAK